jgi:DNA topoisomerase-1
MTTTRFVRCAAATSLEGRRSAVARCLRCDEVVRTPPPRSRRRLRRTTSTTSEPAARSGRRAGAARRAAVEDEDAVESAAAAGLRHVTDDGPGIRRLGGHPRFRYVDGTGRPVRDRTVLARIRALVIPPAWVAVWICPIERGHIQATGRDARGRKQYRYHARWRAHRDANKYSRMLDFGRALRRVRSAVDRDLALAGLPRAKVLATVVRLLELTHARIGNPEYAKSNRSYGLTTLERRHVHVHGDAIAFRFRGKSGKVRVHDVKDPRVARVVRKCEELPGQHLFEYVDDCGTLRAIGSHDVNEYIRRASRGAFSAKDFRTLAGTVLAARALRAAKPGTTKAERKQRVRAALEYVSARLGNTVAVCRKCYVHPAVLEAYERSELGAEHSEARHEEDAVLRLVARCPIEDDDLALAESA